MGITLDFGHSIYGNENPAEAASLIAESDFELYIHINDNDARWDWEQQRENYNIEGNYKNTTLSDEQKRTYEKEQFNLDRSVIDVEIANRGINNASLYAPFNGLVTQVNGEVNEWVSAFSATPLVQIVDFSSLFFQAEVDQEDSDNIKIGQKAIVKLDARKNSNYQGLVYRIDRTVTTTSDNDTVVLVRIRLDNELENLKLGWKGDAQIVLKEKKDVILVPKKAVERKDGEIFVSIWKGQRVVKKVVKLGTFDGTYWEVLEGISESEELALPK